MTDRKPSNVSIGGWVEGQILRAQRRGEFDNLPGQGEPLRGLNEPHDDMTWIAAKLRRENLSVTAVLPPSLALAKEVEDLPGLLARERSEKNVRAIVTDLNDRILAAHRRPQEGPPMRVMTRDVEKVVAAWREGRGLPPA